MISVKKIEIKVLKELIGNMIAFSINTTLSIFFRTYESLTVALYLSRVLYSVLCTLDNSLIETERAFNSQSIACQL